MEGKSPSTKFQKFKNLQKIDYVIYADFEALTAPADFDDCITGEF
jgi:hypothetical protein